MGIRKDNCIVVLESESRPAARRQLPTAAIVYYLVPHHNPGDEVFLVPVKHKCRFAPVPNASKCKPIPLRAMIVVKGRRKREKYWVQNHEVEVGFSRS